MPHDNCIEYGRNRSHKLYIDAIGAAPMPATYTDLILQSNPVGYWPLDDAAGTVARAIVGAAGTYKNTPTLGAAGPSPALPLAVRLDGLTQHVEIAAGSALDGFGEPLSLEAWVLPEAGADDKLVVMDKGTGGYDISGWGSFIGAKKSAFFVLCYDGGFGLVWKHIVFTKTGTAQFIYVNGVEQSLTVSNTTAIAATANALLIGKSQAVGAWQGKICHVAVYNRILSPGEVTQHYAASGV